jgi:gas vesicle protein
MGVFGKTLKFTLGLGLGAVIGSAVALLVAPQSGRVTKETIQARVNEMMSAGRQAQHDRERELQDYWEQEIDIKGQRGDGKDEDKDK